MTESVRIGGLMRCCLVTLEEMRANPPSPAEEGDVLGCRHCKGEMVFRDRAWEWNDPRASADDDIRRWQGEE